MNSQQLLRVVHGYCITLQLYNYDYIVLPTTSMGYLSSLKSRSILAQERLSVFLHIQIHLLFFPTIVIVDITWALKVAKRSPLTPPQPLGP